MKFLTAGNITALLGVAAVLAGAFGKSTLASFFSDPDTAAGVLQVIGVVTAAASRLGVKV